MKRRYRDWEAFGASLPADLATDLWAELHPDADLASNIDAIERAARAVLALHDWPDGHGWWSESADCREVVAIGPDWRPDPDRWSPPIGPVKGETAANLRREGLALLYRVAALRAALGRGDAAAAAAASFQAATERALILRALEDGDRINKGFSQERRGRKDDVMIERRRRDRELRAEGVTSARKRAEMIADQRGEDFEAVRKSLRKMH